MADNSGGLPRCLKTKPLYSGRDATRLPKNPISRLQYRELGGIHRHHRKNVNNQIFQKLPGRLGFSLRNLVDESVLQEGHVFLGFSKNGQFVLSYTLHVEADEHTAYPIYVYRLQWWHFLPYKRLRKVAEVRLFGEEEIQQDLYIAICEWPTDETRILVYGYCAPSDNEEKHQCYITITAVPPVGPCEDCSQLAILHAQSGFHGSLYEAAPRCLNHAFTVHTKYELAPPYPSFAPKIYLKLDGVLIVNTGDSLIALSVDIEDNHGGFGFGLYSPRVTRSVSNISTASSSPSEDRMSYDSQDRLFDAKPFEELENNSDLVLGVLAQSPCSKVVHTSRVYVPKDKDISHSQGDGAGTPLRPHLMRERHASTGKENVLTSPLANMDTGARHDTPKNHRSMDVYNFEGSTPKKDEADTGDYYEVVHSSPGNTPPGSKVTVRASLPMPAFQQSASMGVSAEEINLFQSDAMDSQPLDDLDKYDKQEQDGVFQKPSDFLRIQSRDLGGPGCSSRPMPGLTLIPPDSLPLPLSKTICISPGCGKLEQATGSSTCSSCVSSPIILQSDSQCFTYSVRRYMEQFGRPESPVDMEDDLNLAYHSVLPLEVHGANYCNMRLLNKQYFTPQMPCVVVKQLTLDIEHYLGETVRTTAEWGHRYMAFTDYDVQIVEVCPDTSEVIALVFVLIRARPPHKDHKHTHGMRSIPKLYQSGFKLIWNLQTGSYTTLDVEDLVEVNQAELLRKRWQPGHRVCDAFQRRFAVPQVYSKSVHVLTNEAVFKGQSLKMLLDRHHYVAILL